MFATVVIVSVVVLAAVAATLSLKGIKKEMDDWMDRQ